MTSPARMRNHARKGPLTLLPALLLAVSCADAPRYERPVVAMPASVATPASTTVFQRSWVRCGVRAPATVTPDATGGAQVGTVE